MSRIIHVTDITTIIFPFEGSDDANWGFSIIDLQIHILEYDKLKLERAFFLLIASPWFFLQPDGYAIITLYFQLWIN